MSTYSFNTIEEKWQNHWRKNHTYKVSVDSNKPKYYVLDMFPYPSGAGLHVGHPLGYISSDIVARYKTLKGFNVLHPMGFDSFGLPAEQYAIQTGQHPAITTEENIKRYKLQLDKIGFCYDWSKEIRTTDPNYYKWTQWIFIQLFESWYNHSIQKAEPISTLISHFENNGYSQNDTSLFSGYPLDKTLTFFSAEDWKSFSELKKSDTLLLFRLAFISEAFVNWCPELGTVLSNDEVKEGLSERGGYPVERKLMKQWSLRITAYADRLISGLETIDWSESIKESQRNWIGKSTGASLRFNVAESKSAIEVYTTRPDTIFGVSFLTLAPETELATQLTTADNKAAVDAYIQYAKNRTERERQTEVKKVTGVFTGSFAIHPFTGNAIPIWISDYVLAGYGTGAVMGVPAHDTRDFGFAKHFNIPITQVIDSGNNHNYEMEAFDGKFGICINSDFLNGLSVQEAIKKACETIESKGLGKAKTNFRLRDAIFGRQRYWGEPIPMKTKGGIPTPISTAELPLVLPEVDQFLPTSEGEPPLARAKNWDFETTTMPGWAGSSWYFLRYMDPENKATFASKENIDYWNQVDLYMGGSEHATGHLLYSRFWTKFLFDRGFISFDEPFKKLVNQGMIQGRSNFVYRINGSNKFVSFGLRDLHQTTALHVDVNIVKNDILDLEAFVAWRPEFTTATFELEDGKYRCGSEVEKMSKSKHNVVSPDALIEQYGADTLRLYEMFLGPLELSKPWDMNGIEGVYRFLNKFWRLFHSETGFEVTNDKPTLEEFKILHKTLKKVEEDIQRFSFNTSIPAFMICVNELTALKCRKREILEPLVIAISSFTPHISEELWLLLGNKESITKSTYPPINESYLVENTFSYPIQINGKVRSKIELPLSKSKVELENELSAHPQIIALLQEKDIKKLIVVPGRIINIVC